MIDPQGPLPSEVYWRRRVVAIVAAVVAIAVVIGLIVWAGGSGDDDPNPTNASAAGSAAQSESAAAPQTESTKAPAPQSSEAPSGGGNHGQGGDPSAPAPEPSESGESNGSAAPAEPAIENLCADQSLSVVLYTDKPTYTQGDQPVFTIVTTNGGLAACNRDVGKNAQNVIIRSLDGARTLWSAKDCAPDRTVNVQLLQPGQQVSDDVVWSGTTSTPGCKTPRVQIPAGAYQVIAKIGEKKSAPITFNVVKPAQQ